MCVHISITFELRNLQKRARKTRHEREKVFMEQLRGLGHAVGEYVGGGRAEIEQEEDDGTIAGDESRTEVEMVHDDRQDDGEDREDLQDREADRGEDITENAHPLLFFFDTETTVTGLSIYDDHIVEIAAKVVGVPRSNVTQPSFSSLIHTPKNIPTKGMLIHVPDWAFKMVIAYTKHNYYVYTSTVTEKTGISATMLRQKPPLSVVLPDFFKWLGHKTAEVSSSCNTIHYPG